MPVDIAQDDIVPSREAAEANEREPLVVVDGLVAFLDREGIGSGEPEFEPIGEGHSNVTFSVRRGDARFVLRRPPRGATTDRRVAVLVRPNRVYPRS